MTKLLRRGNAYERAVLKAQINVARCQAPDDNAPVKRTSKKKARKTQKKARRNNR